MPTIKYSDGTKIKFNGTPTEQDVEEAYNQAKGIKTQAPIQPQVQEKTFLQKAAGVTDALFGGGKIGEAIGTGIAKLRATPEERQYITPGPSTGELVGSALQSAALFTPVGKVAKGITTGAKVLGLTKGVSALSKIGSGALTGEVFDISTNLQEGKTGTEALTPGLGTAIGGAIPGIGVAKNVAVRFGESQAPRIINSLIKPLAKDFSYGKNPGRTIAELKIVANNFDELATKIRESRQTIGQEIGELGSKLGTKQLVDIGDALMPLNEAMKTAASQNNPTLLSRLANVKKAITSTLEPMVDDAGNIGIKETGKRKLEGLTFQEARDVLGDIGDITQFTGNPSDDKIVNSALKQIYGNIKNKSLTLADSINPQLGKDFRKLTERYADLSSAEIATKYRDKIVERSNLVGLNPTTAAIGTGLITAVATGGAALPAVLAGITGGIVDKLASTPGFKTRLAAILSKKAPEEIPALFQKIPVLQRIFPKGSAISPGDRLLETKMGQKVEKKVIDYAKDPKVGLSVRAIKASPDIVKNIYKELRDYKPFKPLKVNGEKELGNVDQELRLQNLRNKFLQKGTLTEDELIETSQLLYRNGIDVRPPINKKGGTQKAKTLPQPRDVVGRYDKK